jgi:hypothetical protein
MFCSFGPCLHIEMGSDAATCPTAPDPASLLRQLLVLPHASRHRTLPPCSGGLRCCHVSHDCGPHLLAREGSSAVICRMAPDPTSEHLDSTFLLWRAPVLPRVTQLWTPPHCSGGLWCCHVSHDSRPRAFNWFWSLGLAVLSCTSSTAGPHASAPTVRLCIPCCSASPLAPGTGLHPLLLHIPYCCSAFASSVLLFLPWTKVLVLLQLLLLLMGRSRYDCHQLSFSLSCFSHSVPATNALWAMAIIADLGEGREDNMLHCQHCKILSPDSKLIFPWSRL